jgi:hypothetical protein
MNRGRRVAAVIVAGLIAGAIANLIAPSSEAAALCFLAAGLVLGELLVLRLEDGSAIPLSYAVLIVLASSFEFPQYAAAVIGAEVICALLRFTGSRASATTKVLFERIAVAAATYGAFVGAQQLLGDADGVGAVLLELAAAAGAQVLVDVALRAALRMGAAFSPRGRLAWLAVSSSGMLMAIGYVGVGGKGELGLWGPLLFSTPLLAAWYAFERLDSATRAYRQTIEALAMAPECGGIVPPGHAARVATIATRMAETLGLPAPDVADLEIAALLHHLGQVTLDDPVDPASGVEAAEVAQVTGAMLREIRPLAAAGDIVAGDMERGRRKLAVQILRVASEYDDLAVRDGASPEVAIASLASAPGYVYDPSVIRALERVVRAPAGASV